jgi:hypothetical protein
MNLMLPDGESGLSRHSKKILDFLGEIGIFIVMDIRTDFQG